MSQLLLAQKLNKMGAETEVQISLYGTKRSNDLAIVSQPLLVCRMIMSMSESISSGFHSGPAPLRLDYQLLLRDEPSLSSHGPSRED